VLTACQNDALYEGRVVKSLTAVMQIALLFLANISVTNELIWAAFFKAAGHHPSLPAYILPPSNFVTPQQPHPKIDRLPECLYPGMMQQLTGAANVSAEQASHACLQLSKHIAFASRMSEKCKSHAPSVIDDQQLFNVYMHSAYPELVDCNSIFAKYQIRNRVYTKHGYCQFATMAGALALLQTALLNPENTHFMQLSDTSIPLYHPALVYVHFLSLSKPYVNACPHEPTLQKAHRYPSLFTGQFLPRHWRKSMAWFVLQRDWAQFVLHDRHVIEVFKRWCVSPKQYCNCIADEHYIASLFASYEMDNMTECRYDIHYQDWARIKASHPHSFKVEEINSTLLPLMRGHHCVSNYETSMASALHVLNMTTHVESLDKLYDSMPLGCSLFARKFPANTQQAVYAMLTHGDNADPFHE
jgi:hypothetical protein